jgi:hypothetical protein
MAPTKRKTGTKTKSKKSSDMTMTYVVVGVLVGLILVLLYIMSSSTPVTTTTQPSLLGQVSNAVSSIFEGEETVEGFSNAEELYEPSKEVLVVFCKMDGCGHCVRFNDNVWSKVEPELNGKKNKSGKVIKMMTVDPKHTLSSDVSGFPTIKKYGDNAAKYVEFKDERTVENFKSFCMN